jgi:hypothetical protein
MGWDNNFYKSSFVHEDQGESKKRELGASTSMEGEL